MLIKNLILIILLITTIIKSNNLDIRVYLCQIVYTENKNKIMNTLQKTLKIKKMEDLKKKEIIEKSKIFNTLIFEFCYKNLKKYKKKKIFEIFKILNEQKKFPLRAEDFLDFEISDDDLEKKKNSELGKYLLKEISYINNLSEIDLKLLLTSFYRENLPSFDFFEFLENFFGENFIYFFYVFCLFFIFVILFVIFYYKNLKNKNENQINKEFGKETEENKKKYEEFLKERKKNK